MGWTEPSTRGNRSTDGEKKADPVSEVRDADTQTANSEVCLCDSDLID